MKKIISFSLAAALCTSAFAQDVNTQERQIDKKSSENQMKEIVKSAGLDGRSFKITFTERAVDVKPAPQSGTATIPENKTMDKAVSDYSMFDANSKVMLTFSDGRLLSPVFATDGCPYKINTSGNEMHAFSAYCRLNTGNKKLNEEISAQDTKMKMDADNAANQQAVESGRADVVTAPATTPPDETKQHLPPGTARDDNAEMKTPPAGTVPPSVQTHDIQIQAEPPVKAQSGMMASVSGVVNGNSIQGTLSWTESDGRKMSYAFSGSAASKK